MSIFESRREQRKLTIELMYKDYKNKHRIIDQDKQNKQKYKNKANGQQHKDSIQAIQFQMRIILNNVKNQLKKKKYKSRIKQIRYNQQNNKNKSIIRSKNPQRSVLSIQTQSTNNNNNKGISHRINNTNMRTNKESKQYKYKYKYKYNNNNNNMNNIVLQEINVNQDALQCDSQKLYNELQKCIKIY